MRRIWFMMRKRWLFSTTGYEPTNINNVGIHITKKLTEVFKMSKNIKTIIAAVLCAASIMSMAACGNTAEGSTTDTTKAAGAAETTTEAAETSVAEESKAEENAAETTAAAEESKAEETTAAAEESKAEETTAAAPAGSEDMFLDPKAPQKVGEWIKSCAHNTTSDSDEYIEWRVVSAGEEAAAEVEKYNSEDHIWTLTEPEQDFIKYYKVVYEVKYPEDLEVSDTGLYIGDVDLYAENPEGGGFERGGVAYIGLGQCFTVSQDIEKPMPGDTVTYTAVYTMTDNDPDYVFRYSFKDKDGQMKDSFSAHK